VSAAQPMLTESGLANRRGVLSEARRRGAGNGRVVRAATDRFRSYGLRMRAGRKIIRILTPDSTSRALGTRSLSVIVPCRSMRHAEVADDRWGGTGRIPESPGLREASASAARDRARPQLLRVVATFGCLHPARSLAGPTRSPPNARAARTPALLTYSAQGGLWQDPGHAAESLAEARTCGNG
jgi:hypothetical protein